MAVYKSLHFPLIRLTWLLNFCGGTDTTSSFWSRVSFRLDIICKVGEVFHSVMAIHKVATRPGGSKAGSH